MADGLDWSSLRSELGGLAPDRRRLLNREVSAWLFEAASSQRWMSWVGFLATVTGLCGLAVHLNGATDSRFLTIASLVLVVCGTVVSMLHNRRARKWRRAHPFATWRSQRSTTQG